MEDAIDPRSLLLHVRMTLVDFDWRIRGVKRCGTSAYVFARKGKRKLTVRISDHPPSRRRRPADLSIHPRGDRAIDLIRMLFAIEKQLLVKTKKRPRDGGSLDGGQDRSRGRRSRRIMFGAVTVKQRSA